MKDYSSFLICPDCHCQSLIRNRDYFICENCKSIFNDYHNKIVLVALKDKKIDYGKLLVTVKRQKYWNKEAIWDNKIKELIPNGTGYLLDYACGGGQKKWCEIKGYKYIGIDFFFDYGVDIIANGMNLPNTNNSMSCVISQHVMEHIPNPWLGCKEIYRVLKIGGIYIGSTAFLEPFHERSHYNMSHLGLKYMLEETGFTVEKIVPFKDSGIDAIIKTMVGINYISCIIALFFKVFSSIIMTSRKIAAKFFLVIYKGNNEKIERINEFIKEEPLRFTSGFYYVA